MKKVVGGVLLLLILGAAGAPVVSGLLMEKIVKQSFGNLNTLYSETGSGVSLELLRYDRSMYSTEIEWKMKLGAWKAIYGIDEIIFVDRAKNGFTGIVSTTSLEKNEWFTHFINTRLAGKNPLTITTEYSLSGQIVSTVNLDSFSMTAKKEVVAVKAGRAVFEGKGGMKNFTSELSWDGFSVGERVQVEGIKLGSTLDRISTYLWDGSIGYSLAKGRILSNHQQVELVNIKGDYSLDVDREENTVAVVTSFAADHYAAGPQQMDNGFIRIGMVNMDIQGFEEFVKLYTEMVNTFFTDIAAAEDDPKKMRSILQEQLRRRQFQSLVAYEKLLKKGLELQISDLHADLSSGEVNGDMVLRLNRDMTFIQFVPLVKQPSLALDIFSLQSDMSLPASLIGDNSMFLSPLFSGMRTGLFAKDGEVLKHKAETRDGKLFLNGRVVDLQ